MRKYRVEVHAVTPAGFQTIVAWIYAEDAETAERLAKEQVQEHFWPNDWKFQARATEHRED